MMKKDFILMISYLRIQSSCILTVVYKISNFFIIRFFISLDLEAPGDLIKFKLLKIKRIECLEGLLILDNYPLSHNLIEIIDGL